MSDRTSEVFRLRRTKGCERFLGTRGDWTIQPIIRDTIAGPNFCEGDLLMDDIRSLVEIARRRLALTRFLKGVHLALVGAATLALFLVLLAKASPAVHLPWTWLLVGLALAILAGGMFAVRLGGLSAISLAVLVDERLGLKERLSTAFAVRDRGDAFARAAVADAVTTARDGRTHESLRRNFAVQAPSSSWIGLAIAIAAGLCTLLPQGDLFRRDEPAQTSLAAVKKEANDAIAQVERAIEKNDRLAEAMGKKTDAPISDSQDPANEMLKTPDELKREAIKKMSEMQRQLEDVLKSKEAQSFDLLKKQLANLDPKEGPAEELGDALKQGDFTKAKQALEDLKKSAQGKTDAEKQQLEKQLTDMAGQLGKLAENQKSLENALQKAGLDAQLANNPQALQQAMQNAKNLTDAQKQAIQQSAAAQQAAAEQCKGMSKAMQQAAKQMCQGGQNGGQKQGGQKNGDKGQEGAGQNQQNQQAGAGQGGAGEMGEMLGAMEGMQQMLNAAEAAANECKGGQQGMGQGMGQMAGNGSCNGDGDCQSQKNGWQGGGGRASGGSGAQSSPTPTGTKVQKEKVESTQGEIIMKQLVEGETVAGTSQIKAERVAADIAKSMEGGVTEEQVPTHLQDVHKHYFGELKRYIDAKARGETPAVAAPVAPATGGDTATKPAK